MFVAAHICFDRQIASRGRSEESKCSIQAGLCHLSRKLTAITGIGFPIPTSFEPRLLLQQSCLALAAPAASQSACATSPGARHRRLPAAPSPAPSSRCCTGTKEYVFH